MVKAASGSHMMGADMTYRCLGNGKYYLMQLDGRIIASGQLEKQKENIIESHSIPSGVYQLVLDFDNMGKYCLKAIKI